MQARRIAGGLGTHLRAWCRTQSPRNFGRPRICTADTLGCAEGKVEAAAEGRAPRLPKDAAGRARSARAGWGHRSRQSTPKKQKLILSPSHADFGWEESGTRLWLGRLAFRLGSAPSPPLSQGHPLALPRGSRARQVAPTTAAKPDPLQPAPRSSGANFSVGPVPTSPTGLGRAAAGQAPTQRAPSTVAPAAAARAGLRAREGRP